MEVKLNPVVFNTEKLREKGLNASKVADKLGVSRECVSKWLNGESMPKPDKLLALGLLLSVTYGDLVLRLGDATTPVLHFRNKTNKKLTPPVQQETEVMADFVKHIAKYSPMDSGIKINPLKTPKTDFDYVASVAAKVRNQLNLPRIIGTSDLVRLYTLCGINIIPAFWGDAKYFGNALRIGVSDNSTWVVLNLDSKIGDFLFWMAHEVGHSIAPTLHGLEAETFAESFAQTLLFPPSEADALYELIETKTSIETIRKCAAEWQVSPYTILKALQQTEARKNVPISRLPDSKALMSFINRFPDKTTVAQKCFGNNLPTPEHYVTISERMFKTVIFTALATFLSQVPLTNPPISNVAYLLGLSPDDAYGLIKYLTERG